MALDKIKVPIPAPSSLEVLRDIADVLQKPPASYDDVYSKKCMKVAALLGVQIHESKSKARKSTTVPLSVLWDSLDRGSWYGTFDPRETSENEVLRSQGQKARSNVLSFLERLNSFVNQVKLAGHMPPDNPFVEIASLNGTSKRKTNDPLQISQQQAENLLLNVKIYVDMMQAWTSGRIKFNSDKKGFGGGSSQLSHVNMSFVGKGGTGNTFADLMRFLPTMDDVKRERARRALSVLDFSKRNPKILFTLDYTPTQSEGSRGCIVSWKRISDASGYVLRRRAVFSEADDEVTLSNEDLRETTKALSDYVKTYALTFMGSVHEDSVFSYLDESIAEGEYYIYYLQAYQLKNESPGSIFGGESAVISLGSAGKSAIEKKFKDLSGSRSLNPWPVFAQHILGDSNYDWVLAGANTRSSLNRSESVDSARKYSYLNASSKFLFEQAEAGKLVRPKDIKNVVQSVTDSIQKYGVGQTIQELLSETGILYYFDGIDSLDDGKFSRAGSLETDTSDLFHVVAAAIDPDTATLDLNSLATNLSMLLGSGPLALGTTLINGESHGGSSPREITMFDPESGATDDGEGALQFVNDLGDIRDSTVDLTTFEGISKLMRVLRILSDFGPNTDQPEPEKEPTSTPRVTPAQIRTTVPGKVELIRDVQTVRVAARTSLVRRVKNEG